MKKTARVWGVLIAVSGLMLSNVAAADGAGFYVQGDVGLANVKVDTGEKFKIKDTFKSLKNSYKDSGFMPRVSAGYDFGNNIRVAGDYTHYKDVNKSANDGNKSLDVESQARSAGISAIYDIPVNFPVRPYVGARLGINKTEGKAVFREGSNVEVKSDSATKVGLGAMVGAGYTINKNLTVDGGYRYNRIAKDIKAHEVSAGVRYTFR